MNIINFNKEKLSLIVLSLVMLIFAVGALYYGSTFTGEKMKSINNIAYKSYLVTNILLVYSFFTIIQSALTKDSKKVLSIYKTNIQFAIFFIFALASYLWTDDKALFTYKFMLITGGIMAFFLAKDIKHTEKNLLIISSVFSLTILIISAIGIFQWLTKYTGGSGAILSATTVTPVTFGNKNPATHVMVILFPIVFYYLIRSKNLFNFTLASFSIISTLLFFYLSGTKGAWVAVLIEFIFLFLVLFFNKHNFGNFFSYKKLLIFGSIVIFYFILFELFIDTPNQFLANINSAQKTIDNYGSGNLGSISSRLFIWTDAISYIVNSPFYGHGLGNFHNELSYDGYFHVLERAHNDLMELTVELGIIGLILFIIYLIFLLLDQIKILSSKTDYLFYSLSFIGILGIFTHSMVSFPFQLGIIPVIFGFIVSIHTQKAREVSKSVKYLPPKYTKTIVLIFLSGVLLFVGITNLQYFKAHDLFIKNSGTQFEKYNKNFLREMPSFPFQDSQFYNAYMEYLNAGYEPRSYEIMDIAIEKNPKNMYALRKQFEIFLNARDFKNAKLILEKMNQISVFHAFSFLSSMEYYKYTNNKEKAVALFDKTIDYFNSKFVYNKALTKYLLVWSVTLGKYQHTEFLFDELISYYGTDLELDTQTVMANFYAYTGNPSKGYEFYKRAQKILEKSSKARVDVNLLNSNVEEYYLKYESQIKK